KGRAERYSSGRSPLPLEQFRSQRSRGRSPAACRRLGLDRNRGRDKSSLAWFLPGTAAQTFRSLEGFAAPREQVQFLPQPRLKSRDLSVRGESHEVLSRFGVHICFFVVGS